jgi:hypothetical protein
MTGAKTTKQARKRRSPSKPVPIKAVASLYGPENSRQTPPRPRWREEGRGGLHGEKSAFRLDKWPRGKIAKRAEGGNVDDEHFSPLQSPRGRTAGQAVLGALVPASAMLQGRRAMSGTCSALDRGMRSRRAPNGSD